ncbi:hypothetical protein [Leifsonia poae]|uniref:hypothetical protein n=1 Tax=Leifsonia poae TaxID=110933 RepID=UPI003D669BF2
MSSAVRASPTPKVRWWRRRPPADLPRFSRIVWWAGHGQLFVAPVLVLASFVVGISSLSGNLGYGVVTPILLAFVLAGMAFPVATSGMMLRAYATSESSVNGSPTRRTFTLILAVIGIALLSVAFTVALVWLMFMASFTAGGLIFA